VTYNELNTKGVGLVIVPVLPGNTNAEYEPEIVPVS
jgi:hypothetical protein